jgi:CheY-like chemotaxis protein
MSRAALVVDDSTLIRRSVARFLVERGYTVETACNGLEAIELLERSTPELIVVDLVMPKMSGSEFIREVRYRPHLSKVLIILVAGRKNSSSAAPPAGADHIVYKDVDLVEQLKLAFDKLGPGRVAFKRKKDDQAAFG